MPTYEYRCKDCSHTFDAYQSFTDDALTECPECGGQVKKVFGNVGISFKGSGFYKTDSRSGGSKTPSNGDTSDTSEKKKDSSSSSSDGSSSAPSSSTSDSKASSSSSSDSSSSTPKKESSSSSSSSS